MGVQFLIDSASDILPSEAAALGVTCIPMQITFGDETYEDSVTLSHGAFYDKMADSAVLPVTSQINPAIYETYLQNLTAKGDEVVVITLSSRLSGTCQSAGSQRKTSRARCLWWTALTPPWVSVFYFCVD